MEKKKIVLILLGIVIIVAVTTMPFVLEIVCSEFVQHPEWSVSAEFAVQLYATFYSIGISILTSILILLSVWKKDKYTNKSKYLCIVSIIAILISIIFRNFLEQEWGYFSWIIGICYGIALAIPISLFI